MIVVTGSSKGIGKGVAIRLAREGAKVVVNYRSDPAGAEEAVVECEAFSGKGNAVAIHGDLGKVRARRCFWWSRGGGRAPRSIVRGRRDRRGPELGKGPPRSSGQRTTTSEDIAHPSAPPRPALSNSESATARRGPPLDRSPRARVVSRRFLRLFLRLS